MYTKINKIIEIKPDKYFDDCLKCFGKGKYRNHFNNLTVCTLCKGSGRVIKCTALCDIILPFDYKSNQL